MKIKKNKKKQIMNNAVMHQYLQKAQVECQIVQILIRLFSKESDPGLHP